MLYLFAIAKMSEAKTAVEPALSMATLSKKPALTSTLLRFCCSASLNGSLILSET
jgi:hypothetical protein